MKQRKKTGAWGMMLRWNRKRTRLLTTLMAGLLFTVSFAQDVQAAQLIMKKMMCTATESSGQEDCDPASSLNHEADTEETCTEDMDKGDAGTGDAGTGDAGTGDADAEETCTEEADTGDTGIDSGFCLTAAAEPAEVAEPEGEAETGSETRSETESKSKSKSEAEAEAESEDESEGNMTGQGMPEGEEEEATAGAEENDPSEEPGEASGDMFAENDETAEGVQQNPEESEEENPQETGTGEAEESQETEETASTEFAEETAPAETTEPVETAETTETALPFMMPMLTAFTELKKINITASADGNGNLKLYFDVDLNNLTGGSGGETCDYKMEVGPDLGIVYLSSLYMGGARYSPYLNVNSRTNGIYVSAGTFETAYFHKQTSWDNRERALEFRGTWTLGAEDAEAFLSKMTADNTIHVTIYEYVEESFLNTLMNNGLLTVSGLTAALRQTVCTHENKNYTDTDENEHSICCSDCGISLGKETHHEEAGKCKQCGHVFSVSGNVHAVRGDSESELLPLKAFTLTVGAIITAENIFGYIPREEQLAAVNGDLYFHYDPMACTLKYYDAASGSFLSGRAVYDGEPLRLKAPVKEDYEFQGYIIAGV